MGLPRRASGAKFTAWRTQRIRRSTRIAAWHRAHAASVPDEEVAGELEHSAARVEVHGGFAAAAAFLERAAALTTPPAPCAACAGCGSDARPGWRTRRRGRSARVKEVGALDQLNRARVELLCAWIAFGPTPGSDAPTMLLEAPRRLTPLSPTLASETLLEASRPQTTGFRDASVAPCGDIGGREANRERQEVEVDSPTRSDAPSWAPSQLGSLHGLHMRQARSDGSNGTRLDHAPASTVLDRLWGTGSEPNGTCGSCTGTFR